MAKAVRQWHLFEWFITFGFFAVGILCVFFAPSVQAWYITYCHNHPWYVALMPQTFQDYVFNPGMIWSYRLEGGVILMLGFLGTAVLLGNKRGSDNQC